ncbi:methyltransferase [Candidatus Woesearchaeota archaeon]|jgi:release factor glutamine methyltransferase|nr:methyltransferase [Candidatus Woesearchaeota archaeon]MBT4368273.1 methyltransferase [Candidatus Woesearchaeota archaeon]MBT4712762.1 methyltransferase [Candidatus Woesearchaeota archaeon]MBT6639674.1 methyltransferase [Candidatus Woesearchaeota archaeon]MBT7133846.1 methyltransferase [Candidatus Woesearchaeota archaeon]
MDVYEPAEDSELIKKHIKDFARGIVLDMGTGSGILAKEALKYAKTVYAADINPDAKRVEGVKFIESDLFSNIPKIKFDLILFNAPYLPNDEGIEDPALYGGKEGHETIFRFFSQAKEFLKADGKILLVFSSFTKQDKIDEFLTKNNWKFEEVDKVHISFEDIILYSVSLG